MSTGDGRVAVAEQVMVSATSRGRRAENANDRELTTLLERRPRDDESQGRSLAGELVRVTLRRDENAIWANLTGLVAFAALAIGDAPLTTVGLWSLAVTIVLVCRYYLIQNRIRSAGFPEPASRLMVEYAIGATLTGIVFGIGFLIFVPAMAAYERALILVAISAMCASGAVSMSGSRAAYYGYASSIALPALGFGFVMAFRQGDLVPAVEAWLLATFIAIMVFVHSGAGSLLREFINLQIENDRFVASLEQYSTSVSKDRDAYREASLTDALTQISNRRSFDEALTRMWRNGAETGTTLGCLLVDVDLFKLYNDRYGHDAGDTSLRTVASALDEVARRNGDFAARYGGEEFVILLPDTTAAGALYIGELTREAVESLALTHADSPHHVVTVSVGASATVPTLDESPEELVKRADDALYHAKASGRNRVQLIRDTGTLTADSGLAYPATTQS